MSEQEIVPVYNEPRRALYAFLCKFLTPKVADDHVLCGNQPDMVLPADGNDYVIFHINQQIRHGTTVEEFDPDREVTILKESAELVAQVDCYGTTGKGTKEEDVLRAQMRAHNLELAFSSSPACTFFKKWKMAPLYADGAQDTTLISDSNQYLQRWTTYLHLGIHTALELPQEGFTELDVIPNSLFPADSSPEEYATAAGKLNFADVDVKIKVKSTNP